MQLFINSLFLPLLELVLPQSLLVADLNVFVADLNGGVEPANLFVAAINEEVESRPLLHVVKLLIFFPLKGNKSLTGLTTSWTCWRHLCIKLYPNYSCLSDLRFLRKKLSLDGIEVCDLKKRQSCFFFFLVSSVLSLCST